MRLANVISHAHYPYPRCLPLPITSAHYSCHYPCSSPLSLSSHLTFIHASTSGHQPCPLSLANTPTHHITPALFFHAYHPAKNQPCLPPMAKTNTPVFHTCTSALPKTNTLHPCPCLSGVHSCLKTSCTFVTKLSAIACPCK